MRESLFSFAVGASVLYTRIDKRYRFSCSQAMASEGLKLDKGMIVSLQDDMHTVYM